MPDEGLLASIVFGWAIELNNTLADMVFKGTGADPVEVEFAEVRVAHIGRGIK
jgi:hypothetical protein